MAITLQTTVNVAQLFVRQLPLTGVGGIANQPALQIGDWVRQFILAPPFAWRWNRNTTSFVTAAGTQDYTKSLSDFGWLEKATANGSSAAGAGIWELVNVLNLGEENIQNLPQRIAARIDDGAGNITFRLSPVPDAAYTINISYQKSAPVFAALTDSWGPIPDYLSYLYDQGFLAKSYEYANNEKFAFAMQLFMRQVIAANAGLSDTQINLFMDDNIISSREAQSKLGDSQSGRQGRGLF